jgi:hypothetical protein
LRKKGQFHDQPTSIDVFSWRKWLPTLDTEILRFAQDDSVLTFSAACKAESMPGHYGTAEEVAENRALSVIPSKARDLSWAKRQQKEGFLVASLLGMTAFSTFSATCEAVP